MGADILANPFVLHEGVTTANGVGCMIDSGLIGAPLGAYFWPPDLQNMLVILYPGDLRQYMGEASDFDAGTGTILVSQWYPPVGSLLNVPAGTPYMLASFPLNNSTLMSLWQMVSMLTASLAQVPARISTLYQHNPLELFWEPWQDEIAGINPAFWATVSGGTGTVARDTTEAGVLKVLLNCPAVGDTARLRSIARWRTMSDTWWATIVKELDYTFRFKVDNLANLDDTVTIIGGLTPGVADTRASSDIAAIILSAGNFAAVTDVGGVETISPLVLAADLDQWLLGVIQVWRGYSYGGWLPAGWERRVRFSVKRPNGHGNSATHTTHVPIQTMYLQHYAVAGGGAGALHIGEVKAAYYEMDEAYVWSPP